MTDYGEIASHGVMSTPGLVIDGTVVLAGRVPTREQVAGWLGVAQDFDAVSDANPPRSGWRLNHRKSTRGRRREGDRAAQAAGECSEPAHGLGAQ